MFFGTQSRPIVVLQTTNMLFELGLPGFDTVIHNSKAVFEKTRATTQKKRKKSCFLKSEKTLKNAKKRTVSQAAQSLSL